MTDNIHTSLDYLYRIAHTKEDWITPLVEAVESVQVEEAGWSPAQGVASIWEIVFHASGWLEDTLRTLTGSPGPEHVDWPRVEDGSDTAWRASQQHLRSLVFTLHDVLKHLGPDELFECVGDSNSSRARMIISMAVHDSYHAGQVVKIKQLYKSAHKADTPPRRTVGARAD